ATRAPRGAPPRGALGPIATRGRLDRAAPVDLPSVPATSVQLAAGARIGDYLGIADKKERVLGLVSLTSEEPITLGTRQGVVKRVAPGGYPNRPDFEVISLKAGDEVMGAGQGPDSLELVFVTSDAQLLHFSAAAVRPQGAAAGGMAGINLSGGAEVIFFGAVEPADAVVVTLSTPTGTLPGT